MPSIKMNDIPLSIATKPVNESSPAGENIRYDDDFELLEDELSKQGALIDRGKVNWKKIIEVSVDILAHKSKDLKVSCYLSRALFECYGFSGLAKGLAINHAIIDTYWDELFPAKPRARANAYEWLTSKLEPMLEDQTIPEGDIEADALADYEQCFTFTKTIEEHLNDKLADHAPALGNMRRSLKDLYEQVDALYTQQQEIKQAQEKARQEQGSGTENHAKKDAESATFSKASEGTENLDAVQQNTNVQSETANTTVNVTNNSASNNTPEHNPSQTSVPTSAAVNIINTSTLDLSEKERNQALKQCQEAMRNIAAADINKNLDNASAYAINRMSTWININQLPVHKDGVTPLKPVPADKRNRLMELLKQGQYQELIPLAEASFSRSPFWLDAHRIVYQSLESLGFTDAAKQVKEYLAIFLRRFPDIVQLKFSDQSDFADEQTRQWINTQVLENNNAASAMSLEQGDSNTGQQVDQQTIFAEAKALVQKQQLKEAIALYHKQIEQQSSTKQKIFWKYYLAQFCYEQGQQQLSASILQEIDRFIQNNHLQYWEPELARNVTYLLYQILKNSSSLETVFQTAREQSGSVDDGIDANSDTEVSSIHAFKNGMNKNTSGELEQLYSRLCQLDPVLALELS